MPSLWLYVLLTVVFESEPSDSSLLAWALESCSEALVDSKCVAADSGEQAQYRARVRWDDALHAHIALRREDAERTLVGERRVEFTPRDRPNERYRALGVIAAAWVLAEQPGADDPPPEDERPRRRAARLPPWPSYALDVAAILGPGLDRGPPRVGAAVRGRLPLWRAAPWLGVLVAARGTYRPDEPRFAWTGLSVGLSARYALHPRVAAEARLEAVGALRLASARDPNGEDRERKVKPRAGGQAGLELFVRLSPRATLFVGGEAARYRPRAAITVGGGRVGRERSVELAALAGVRVAF